MRRGWFGNPVGHSLASRGYASKKQDVKLVDPVFYVKKREEHVPFDDVMDEMRDRVNFEGLKRKYPDADEEDVRRQGIRALDTRDGTDIMSTLDKNGVDSSVRLAKMSPALKQSMLSALGDSQKVSFMHPMKVDSLKRRLYEV